MADVDSLLDIFRMMAPADLYGGQRNSVGSVFLSSGERESLPNVVEEIIRIVQSPGGNGSLGVEAMFKALNSFISGDEKNAAASEDELRSLFRSLRVYGILDGQDQSEKFSKPGLDWHLYGSNFASKDNAPERVYFNQFVPIESMFQDRIAKATAAIVLSDGNFIHPGRHSVNRAEMFMNFIPAIVMQRCVPYVSAEFVVDGRSFSSELGKFARPGLLRFLMGGDTNASTDADAALLRANNVPNPRDSTVTNTVMGMEAFTAPQTLINPGPEANAGRIIPVQDPMRPLATLENLTIEVHSTIGFMSNKTANLTMKLHDRSRMNELADFVKPATYPKTTVWLTYGWRHPVEPGNPYAEFINGNMLIREAYGIQNSSYSFDNVGQVQITLQLYTRGMSELLDLKFNNLTNLYEDMARVVEQIKELNHDLKLEGPMGLSKEIRATQLLEAGSQGSFPNLSDGEINKMIIELQGILRKGYDQTKAQQLMDALRKMYDPNYQKKSADEKGSGQSFKHQVNAQNAFGVFHRCWANGPDPFLMTGAQNAARLDQWKVGYESKYGNLIDTLNQEPVRGAEKAIKNQKITSFGKVMSSVLLSSVLQTNGADQLFIYFYRINRNAGLASGANLAEFPIELDRLRADLNSHITKNRTDRMTLETFLSILVESQVEDMRAPAYGLREYFEPYDPKNPDIKLKQKDNPRGNKNLETVGTVIRDRNGPIQKPIIAMYVEMVHETNGSQGDLLGMFKDSELDDLSKSDGGTTAGSVGTSDAKAAARKVTKIMKIHIYDKALDLYPHATVILGAQNDPATEAFRNAIATYKGSKDATDRDVVLMQTILDSLDPKLRSSLNLKDGINVEIIGGNDGLGTRTFHDLRRLVSQAVPSIIVGGSTSNVISAQLQSKTDSLTSIAIMKGASAGKGSPMAPAGGGEGNLPLKIFPATLSLSSMGNPLFRYSQSWFIDFNTGTTADALYNLTGLTHTLTPGKFESQCTFSFGDGYGKYQSPSSVIQQLSLTDPAKNIPPPEDPPRYTGGPKKSFISNFFW